MIREAYWRLRALVRHRTLQFFVSEPGAPAAPNTVDIRCGGLEHAEAAARMATLRGHDPAEYRDRLQAGHLVVYAVAPDGSPQSWGWATAPIEGTQDAPWEFGIRMRTARGSGFLWDYFTPPDYRGRGLYKLVLRASADECFRRGAHRAWGYADVTNAASRRGLSAAAYTDALTIELLRLGPFCRMSRPGFQTTVRLAGFIELDRLVS
jgi:GNAT superfamily N-acetyltransferase